MARPTLNFKEKPELKVASLSGSMMNMILAKTDTFVFTTTPFRLNSTDPFNAPNKTVTALTGKMGTDLHYQNGFQYDVRKNTIVACSTGIVTEYALDGTPLRTVDWSAHIGVTFYLSIILGYENESHFYILSRSTNILYKCNRDFSGVPIVVMTNFKSGVNYHSSWTINGFFNGTQIYMLGNGSGNYKLLRTDISNKSVTEIALANASGSIPNTTYLMLGVYQGRIVFTFAPYNDNTYPALFIYDIDDQEPISFLIQDGNELKSYSDTGYTKNVCVGGAVISSSGWETGHPNADAFDGNMDTYWGSNETGLNVRGNAFIGYDFEQVPRHIRRIEITKSTDPASTPEFIKVQHSNDGAVWTDAMPTVTLTKDGGTQVIEVPVSAMARRWRLLAYEPLETGKRWRVRDVKMYERILTGWYTVGIAPATPDMFRVNGLGSIDFMTHELMRYLSNPDFKVHGYMEQPRANVPTLEIEAVPHRRVIYPKEDISLYSIYNIDKFTITGTELNGGIIRVIVSIDKGATWQTWDTITDKWKYINDKSMDEVRGAGMSMTTFNARTSMDWMALNAKEIRFAYYLEQVELTDEAATSLVTMQADMRGTWEKAKEKDYTYGYADNDRLTVRFFTDGSYKVNYGATV